jgi:hypothetical protein
VPGRTGGVKLISIDLASNQLLTLILDIFDYGMGQWTATG